jgi:hypothetical protein
MAKQSQQGTWHSYSFAISRKLYALFSKKKKSKGYYNAIKAGRSTVPRWRGLKGVDFL